MASFDESNEKGKFGEAVSLDYLTRTYEKLGWKVHDVRTDKYFQLIDIDFILLKNGKTPEEFIDWYLSNKIGDPSKINERMKWAKTVEVKTDAKTFYTRNLVYEVISHCMAGCLGRSNADIILYVCLDNKKIYSIDHIKEIYSFNLRKIREYMILNCDKKLEWKKNKSALFLKGLEEVDNIPEYILNILVDIDGVMKSQPKEKPWCVNITNVVLDNYGTTCEETNS